MQILPVKRYQKTGNDMSDNQHKKHQLKVDRKNTAFFGLLYTAYALWLYSIPTFKGDILLTGVIFIIALINIFVVIHGTIRSKASIQLLLMLIVLSLLSFILKYIQ